MTSARDIAYEVLLRIQTQRSYADALLDALLKGQKLPATERRFAKALVFGTLRNRTLLEHYLMQAGPFQPERTDVRTASALRLGAYQVIFMDRVPDSAAVNESVRIVKDRCKRRKDAGFVNALLRRLVRSKSSLKRPQVAFGADEAKFVESAAVAFSFPEYLVQKWRHKFARKELVALLSKFNEPPVKAVRVNIAKITVSELSERLAKRGFDAQHSPVCPSALRLSGPGPLEETPEWREGLFTVQDEGPQVLSLLVGTLGPRSIVDVCAGVGQKLTLLAERFPTSVVVGNDIHLRKIQQSREQAKRLGLKNVRLVAGDLLSPSLRPKSFDLVILDAPCSGTGTIRRHPEIRWRVRTSHLRKTANMALKMLESCTQLVNQSGTIVYSTCSLEPEENEHVIKKFLSRNADFEVCRLPELPAPLRRSVGEFGLTLLPHFYDCDGMFFSLLRRSTAG
ncbi:MAG: hypothetical protein DRH70_00740 [Candidatus Coatesbacteria bacterium]|nr:MAG: hypothetical protein DRH70_00740 [Candidatus Coatesbacteria bacterium]